MIYVGRDGEIIGQFDDATFRQKLARDEILWTDYFLPEGSETWKPVSDFPFGDRPKQPPLLPIGQQKTRITTKGILLAIGILILLGVIIDRTGWGGGWGRSRRASKGAADISLGASDFVLRVTNNGTTDWNEMVIYLNDTPPFTYKWSGSAPEVGQSITIPLREFSKRNGDRFDSYRTRVTQVWVGGDGYDYRGFNVGGN